jgi:predicted RNA-binding protein with PUA-like domain
MKATQYWLLKTEPTSYSIDDLKRDKKTLWTGVRNYQARNFIREMSVGDWCFIYHSSSEPTGVAGVGKITRAAIGDPTALDRKDSHFDPKSSKENPIWLAVEVGFVQKFKEVIPLAELKRGKQLDGMMVRMQGSRLSVQPVSQKHFAYITDVLSK